MKPKSTTGRSSPERNAHEFRYAWQLRYRTQHRSAMVKFTLILQTIITAH